MENIITTEAQNEKDELIRSLREQIALLTAQVEWFKRQLFGTKSERIVDLPGDIPDLPGFVVQEPEHVEPETVTVPEHVRHKSKDGKGENVLVLPDDLPVVEVVHALPEERLVCPKTGKAMVEIGRESVDKLARREGDYYIKRHVHLKYAVPGEALSGVVQAPSAPCVIEGSKFDPSFMADLVSEKFGAHLPLNRYQERLESQNIRVSRQTLSALVTNLGGAVRPLYDLMRRRVLESGVIFTDDTPVRLIDKEKRGTTRQAHMWIYLAGRPNAPPYHVYHFTENWSHAHPTEFLRDFCGVIHADAFDAYAKIDAAREDVAWAACWAHARRNFEEALGGGKPEFALRILRIMRHLFLYERVAWNRSPEERLAIRREREAPLVEELFASLREKLSAPDLLPKSKIAEAIQYMLGRKKNFTVYLENPDVRMDNNPSLSSSLENPQVLGNAA